MPNISPTRQICDIAATKGNGTDNLDHVCDCELTRRCVLITYRVNCANLLRFDEFSPVCRCVMPAFRALALPDRPMAICV